MKNIISYQNKIVKTYNLFTLKIDEVFNLIHSGYNQSIDFRLATKRIQALSDHNEQNKLKCNTLPYACFNGVFNHRSNDGLIEYSNYTAIDFDGFQCKDDLQNMIANLWDTSFVKFLFRSPSGRGLKAIVEHTNINPKKHYALYQELLAYFKVPQIDPKTKDLSRATFLCYDPNALWNYNCQPYNFDESKYPEQEVSASSTGSSLVQHTTLMPISSFDTLTLSEPTSITDGSIQRILGAWLKNEKISVGNRNDTMYRYACTLCKAGVKWNYALSWLTDKFGTLGLCEEEVYRTAYSAYSRYCNLFGSERDSRFLVK